MSRIMVLLLLLIPGFILPGMPTSEAASSSDTSLKGTVKSSDGNPLEGVAVSARAQGNTFTTTVYTDRNGEYFFPPLGGGQYKIWAQAVTFEADSAELEVSASQKMQQNFTLKPLKDFSKQLSGTEWLASLPEDTPEDRRMKEVLQHNCTGCHISSFILQNRFDADGWNNIVSLMSRINVYASIPEFSSPHPIIQAYQKELVQYLTRARGPDSPPLKYKTLPRPTGESARVVITEYDISQGDRTGYISSHNGSDWSQGTPSSYEGRSLHDMAVDQEGNIWFGNTIPLERTLGKLDPRTGHVSDYKLVDGKNQLVQAIGLVVDLQGNVWFSDLRGNLTKFDPRTEKFQSFPRPPSVLPTKHSFVGLDPAGNVWVQLWDGGASKFDPKTGTYTDYKEKPDKTVPPNDTYGIAMDAKGNPWYTQMDSDRVGTVDGRTGEVSVIKLAPLNKKISDNDREIGMRFPAAISHNNSPLYQKGPRRIGADRRGSTVWVSEFWEGRLAKIDINTHKVTEYPVPHPESLVYCPVVDKNHMVWLNLMNSDQIARFNPYTEKFTEFPLPTLGSEARHIVVEDRTDPPTVWVPYYRVNKIARVQFRTAPPTQLASHGRGVEAGPSK